MHVTMPGAAYYSARTYVCMEGATLTYVLERLLPSVTGFQPLQTSS